MLFSKGIRRVISHASGRGIQYRCRSSPRPTVLRIRGLPYSLIQILPPIPSHQIKHVLPESLDFRWSESRDPAEHLDRVWLFPIDRRHHPPLKHHVHSPADRAGHPLSMIVERARDVSAIATLRSVTTSRRSMAALACCLPPPDSLPLPRTKVWIFEDINEDPSCFPQRRRYGHAQSRSRSVRSCRSVSVQTGIRPTLAARSPLEPIARNPEPCIFPIVTAPS